MKILLANITTMVGLIGGVEKVFCNMANEFCQRGYEVCAVYSDNKEGKPYFELNERIKCYNLKHLIINDEKIDVPDKKFPLMSKLMRECIRPFNKNYAREMKENFLGKQISANLQRVLAEESPDLIISHRALTTKYLMLDAKTNIPVITMFHDDPKDLLETATSQVKSSIEKSAIVQVLLPYGEQYVRKYCPKAKIVIIPNTVKQYDKLVKYEIKKCYKIIYIARLSKRIKQQHLLIKAFSLLNKEFDNWQIELWGPNADEGYDKELIQCIQKEHLENVVKLCGSTDKVDDIMHTADIFAYTSRYEGFGIALAEAMSIGLPVIGIKECLAINDLIVDGKTGLLAYNDPHDIADKLRMMMNDIELRKKLGIAAHNEMQKYAPEKIWNIWDKLIQNIVKERNNV